MSKDAEGHAVEQSSEPPRGGNTPPPRYAPPQACTCLRRARDVQDGAGTPATRRHGGAGNSGIDTDKIVKIVAAAAAVPVLATAGAAVMLPILGFTSTGVAGGSLAAMIQSVFYGASTGALFSVFQSVGATIVAPAAIEVVGAVGAAAVGARAIVGGRDGGAPGPGVGAATHGSVSVACACDECVCEEDCDCGCRRRRREGRD